jgi:hypothetical protein
VTRTRFGLCQAGRMETAGQEPSPTRPLAWLLSLLASFGIRTWAQALARAGIWADRRDAHLHRPGDRSGLFLRVAVDVDASTDLEASIERDRPMRAAPPDDHEHANLDGAGPGTPAAVWATTKAALGLAASPLTVPALTLAALRTSRINSGRIEAFPDHLMALAEGRLPPLPGDRTLRRPASQRYLITSDLHRCIPGRLDWPERQRVKDLYVSVLSGYADDGWHLIENGDVEDFWMVGGSTWGAVYDVAYLTGGAVGPARVDARRRILSEQLDRIVDNNAPVYDLLREGFCSAGRYHRTMGNHDDVFADPHMTEQLATHLPGVQVADTILLSADGAGDEDGIEGVRAVVAHGHLTDSWNGHGFAVLGRYVTWLATGLDDLPGVRKVDALPDQQGLERLLGGRASNRLIEVDSRYGGNRRLDTLDEERLFAALDERAPSGGWPWLVYGHTHFPMLQPLNAAGSPVRYANSGCGVLDGAFSALEWDATDPDAPLTLVVWRSTSEGPERTELVPAGARLMPA